MKQPKPPLLLLVHRIPYPPNKGDKIRSFHLLKALSERYQVHLGCFYDDDFDRQYISTLAQWCETVCCLKLSKWRAMLTGLTGFLSGRAITLPYYYQSAMAAWVKQTQTRYDIKKVLVYSSAMAQYVDHAGFAPLTRVIDFVDIDSDKWRQYAAKSSGIKKWFYQREAQRLQQYEVAICQRFDRSLFVSEDEASAFRHLLAPALQAKVLSLPNGVDTDYFSPEAPITSPAPPLPENFIVFTGAMDYWANVDAVCWFCQHVWPVLRRHQPQLQFWIVGGNPTADVQALSQQSGVVVTDRVADVRPYLAASRFAIAPMLIARGIQNKVLEAMAMNKAVVCSPMAMEGINAPLNASAIVADGVDQFSKACLQLLAIEPAPANRQWVLQHFTWPHTLAALPQLIEAEYPL